MTTDTKQAAAPVKALLGRKLGMTQAWDENGNLVPLTVVQVDKNVVTQIRTPRLRHRSTRSTHSPTQQCFHTRHHFFRAKGFAQIIIRAPIETGHPVVLRSLCGRHDYRNSLRDRRLPELSEDGDAVLAGQHDIEEDELRQILFHRSPKESGVRKA